MRISKELSKLIELEENSIHWRYRLYLYEKIMNEIYSKLEFTQSSFEATLKIISHKIKLSNEEITNEEILNRLNSEFIKCDIGFIEDDGAFKTLKYPESGIVRAEADNFIYIYVNDTFFNLIKSDDILNNNNGLHELSNNLFTLYSHEISHVEQNQKQKVAQSGITISNKDDEQERILYLSNLREIDAHAREVTNELLCMNLSPKEIEHLLTTHEGSKKLCEKSRVYKLYYYLFGVCLTIPSKSWDREIKNKIKVFNHFKRRICDFLKLDSNYIDQKQIRYLMGNSDKLKDD